MVVGAPDSFGTGIYLTGEAFIYTKHDGTWSTSPVLLPAPPNALIQAHFGTTVAVSGTTVVVGSEDEAFVYVEQNGQWPAVPTVSLVSPVGGGLCTTDFGSPVAISGDTIAVSGIRCSPRVGSAYLYVESGGRWPTAPTVTLTYPDEEVGDDFGISVAVADDTALVSDLNAVFVYTRGKSGWGAAPTTSFENPETPSNACYGEAESLALVGQSALVGTGCGPAYIYTENAGTWSTTPTVTLRDPLENAHFDLFGSDVALSTTAAVVGSDGTQTSSGAQRAGSTYVYAEPKGGWAALSGGAVTPLPNQTLLDPVGTAYDSFGFAVAASTQTIIVGAPGTDPAEGAVYLYTR